MTHEALLLIGRESVDARDVLETHAERLRRRNVAEEIRTVVYDSEPLRELKDEFAALDADRVYAVPMCVAHTHDTTDGLPAALSYVSGGVEYCEPLGQSPAVTSVISERAADVAPPDDETSLALVGLGSSSQPFYRQTMQYHAARLREESAYGEVVTCFLVQNPAVECVRYDVDLSRTVAVPVFLTRSDATERQIPSKLELGRGGVDYAEPLGDHPQMTDAIHAEVEKHRVLATVGDDASGSFEASLTRTRVPIATDGEGRRSRED